MNILLSPTLSGILRALYLWIVGVAIGGIIACGAFSAPVIFHAPEFGVEIVRFESGLIMTAIFLKLNNLLLAVAFIITIFEILSLRISTYSKTQKSILFLSGAISVICILLFTLYYSPYIVSQQELGAEATSSRGFDAMHTQSEMVFHIMFFTLSVNFLYRVILYSRGKNVAK